MSTVALASRLSPFARPPQLADWLILTAIVVVSVAAAFPLAWMVLTSLKTPAETMQTPPVWFRCAARRRGRGMSAVALPSRLSPFVRPPQLADWLILTAIVVVSVAAAFPLAWMVLTSLKTPAETMQTSPV